MVHSFPEMSLQIYRQGGLCFILKNTQLGFNYLSPFSVSGLQLLYARSLFMCKASVYAHIYSCVDHDFQGDPVDFMLGSEKGTW